MIYNTAAIFALAQAVVFLVHFLFDRMFLAHTLFSPIPTAPSETNHYITCLCLFTSFPPLTQNPFAHNFQLNLL